MAFIYLLTAYLSAYIKQNITGRAFLLKKTIYTYTCIHICLNYSIGVMPYGELKRQKATILVSRSLM